jgi:hypothetical protein
VLSAFYGIGSKLARLRPSHCRVLRGALTLTGKTIELPKIKQSQTLGIEKGA